MKGVAVVFLILLYDQELNTRHHGSHDPITEHNHTESVHRLYKMLNVKVHLQCDSTPSISAWLYIVHRICVLSAHTIKDAAVHSPHSRSDDVKCPSEDRAVRIEDPSMSSPLHIIHNFNYLLCRLYSPINRTIDLVTLAEAIHYVFTVHFLPVRGHFI